ncbi:MAG: PD-(D/E)XK nuclease family protein [Armatimonadota bacterium]
MPRKPILSPTRIRTYLLCEVKYYHTYLNPLGKRYIRARREYSFGSTMHAVLQHLHSAGGVEQVPVEQLQQVMQQQWVQAGYETPEQVAEFQQMGALLLQQYHQQQQQALQQVPPERRPRLLMQERLLRMDMGLFALVGRVDRVDEHPDGTLEIIDYKSLRTQVTPEEVHDDLAMCCYQLLLKHYYPDRRVIATIVALQTGDFASASLSDEELREFGEDIRLLGEEIIARDFEYIQPLRIPHCDECDFLPLCERIWQQQEMSG